MLTTLYHVVGSESLEELSSYLDNRMRHMKASSSVSYIAAVVIVEHCSSIIKVLHMLVIRERC